MKKLFTVLAVLLVATALFAGVTVKAGGTYAFGNFNSVTNEETTAYAKEMKMKAKGFGFGAGVQADIADNLAVYAEFSMAFPSDAEYKRGDSDWVKLSEWKKAEGDDASYKINFLSASVGVAYKLDFNAVKLAVGGGVSFEYSVTKTKFKPALNITWENKDTFATIGLNALVDAKYMFADNIGAGVTLNPQLGLYSIAKHVQTSSDSDPVVTEEAKGFKVGFAMPITVGVSYTF